MSGQERESNAIEAVLAAAFSGDEYEENAADAASEHEWDWWRWLALNTLRKVEPGACGCTYWPCPHPAHLTTDAEGGAGDE